jgi:uncharacterized protein (DUF1800 family)
MTEHRYLSAFALGVRWLCACALLLAHGLSTYAQTPPTVTGGGPVLLTEGTGTTTRGVAYEAVTARGEPFPVVSPYNWNADKSNTRDQQTRVMLFAMNLDLLAGEGANALTADAQDATGRVYPLKVEALTNPLVAGAPQQWLYAIVVRLDDAMTDTLGDVLVRFNLHGVSSNRVRIAVGQATGGIANDPATEFIAPAPPVPPTPTPTPTPKAFGPGESSSADVTRLLEQATWGPTAAEVARVQQMGIRAFVDEQLNAQPLNAAKGSNYPDLEIMPDDSTLDSACPVTRPSDPTYNQGVCQRDKYSVYPLQVQFFRNALAVADASDPQGLARRQNQLRQRVAFALHQIFVVSNRDINYPFWMTPYLQALDRGAFGNYRTLLGEVTLNPAMGEYLNMNQSTAASPNENYAREVLQLFSVGVNRLNPDGTPILDAQGNPVPTYTQTTVNEFTRVFTGWRFAPTLQVGTPAAGATNFRDPLVPRGGTTHDTGAKNLFGTALAGCAGASGTNNGLCAQAELNAALDVIFNHPNVGPFISKQLIQHLVTSNPSPAYVGRVASVFNNDCNGLYPEGPCGARGNMRAVVRAVLLDPEARGDVKNASDYGRLREPAQYIANILRACNASSDGVLGSFNRAGDLPGQLDQPVFQPPTVFSYYTPEYEVPGTKTLGPAFQILYTTTTLRRANIVNTLVYSGIVTGANNPSGTQLDFSALAASATSDQTGGQLVDQLNALLLHGTMSPVMRASMMTAVQSISNVDSSFARKRAQAAVYLVVTSPQYDVQR